MSDKTPERDEFDELTENESAEELEVTEEAATSAVSDPDEGPAAGAGVPRKTASAPVRKKDVKRDVDPEGDDDDIAALEENFTDDEREAADDAVRVARKTAKAPVKKSAPTRKRSASEREEADPYSAGNPVTFAKQSARELKQVVWPTWPELVSYFLAVLVFVLFFIAFIGLLDMFFGWGLLQLLGD